VSTPEPMAPSDVRRFTRAALVALPPVLLAAMYAAFRLLDANMGFPRGYLFAFVLYWVGFGTLVPLAIMGGTSRVLALFSRPSAPRVALDRVDFALLSWPILVAFAFAFVPRVAGASPSVLAISVALGAITGLTEEMLWRGLYVRAFPESLAWSSLYPSVGFALWHLAPLAVRPSRHPGGNATFVVYALLLGLSYARVTRRTGSIGACALSHCIHDALGLGGFAYVGW